MPGSVPGASGSRPDHLEDPMESIPTWLVLLLPLLAFLALFGGIALFRSIR